MSQQPEQPFTLASFFTQPAPTEPQAELRSAGQMLFQMLTAFTDAGFTRAEALQLVMHQMALSQQQGPAT